MWRNYLAVGLRVMLNNRVYAAVNIVGLAIGIAAAMLVFLYVRYETSYDRWLPGSDRIYQLQSVTNPPGAAPSRGSTAPRVAVEALRKDFPEFENVVGLTKSRSVVRVGKEPRFSTIYWSDANFFEVFDLPFLRGDKTALADASGVVLTQSEAVRYFGRVDPIGRILTVRYYSKDVSLRVTGVIADLPKNSHLDLQMIARFNPANEPSFFLTSWGAMMGYVYAELKPGADGDALNRKLAAFEKRNLPQTSGDGSPSTDAFIDFRFAPVRDIHLEASHENAMKPGGDPLAVKAFSIIALLILAIACVNFTNLTTARASQRAREVGVRKVLGATRGQLVAQFLAEAMLLAGIATLMGLALVELLLPSFNSLLQTELGLHYLGENGLFLPVLLLIAVVGTAGGAYPAFYLSRFQPAKVLKANAAPGISGLGRLRGVLVVAQFAASIGLIVCAAVVHAQTLYAQRTDPGYEKRGLIAIKNVGRPELAQSAETLRREIEGLPGVVSTALTGLVPAEEGVGATTSVQLVGGPQGEMFDYATVDYGFFETMKIPVVAGRALSERYARDDASVDYLPMTPDERELLARGMNVVVNEAAARRLGFADPADAVGRDISAQLITEGRVPGTIVGVAKDVRYRSLRDDVRPIMYMRNTLGLGTLLVRYSAADPARIRGTIEGLWRRIASDVPFEAVFVEDELASLYQTDAVRGQIFAIASALAVVIAALGLFGLAAFTVERRKLEIAVRKVFGASSQDIVTLMVWQFSKPVLLANLIAWPVAWWLMRDWLNGFAERISLHAGWFVGAGAAALLVAILTVATHALRVSRTRPVHALRYE